MNRQPTLHKPSMMAHLVRVLPGEVYLLAWLCDPEKKERKKERKKKNFWLII